MKANSLQITVQSREIQFNGEPVVLTKQFFNLYCYLALSRLEKREEEGFVESAEIVQIRLWERNKRQSVGKQISRHLQHEVVPIIETLEKTKGPYRLKLAPEKIEFDLHHSLCLLD